MSSGHSQILKRREDSDLKKVPWDIGGDLIFLVQHFQANNQTTGFARSIERVKTRKLQGQVII